MILKMSKNKFLSGEYMNFQSYLIQVMGELKILNNFCWLCQYAFIRCTVFKKCYGIDIFIYIYIYMFVCLCLSFDFHL